MINALFKALILVSLLALGGAAQAAEPRDFDTPEQAEQFSKLTEELRCTVCQNQSLADSDAILARDLRDEVQAMILQGQSDEEIKTFLVDRYGDFVLYRPPVRQDTLLLWLTPLILLAIGGVVIGFTIKNRKSLLAEEALADAAGLTDNPAGQSDAASSNEEARES